MSEYRFMCTTLTPEVFQDHLGEIECMGIEHHFDPANYVEGEGCGEVLACTTKEQKKWILDQDWLVVVDSCKM